LRGKNGADYELDLVLRNNRTTAQYPLGIFHPHPEKHHIKKENIGLIEVMGLAVLPARPEPGAAPACPGAGGRRAV
jgi:UDPglucose--hexose-1-phosphate uridylyltransferase